MEKRSLSTAHVVWLTLGSLVGAGLVTVTGSAAATTGYSVWLAFGVATVLGFLAVIPYFFAAGTVVLSGGMYTTNALFGNPVLGGLTMINCLPGALGNAVVPIGLSIYLRAIFPNIPTLPISVGAVLIFYVLNLLGINALAQVQKYMMYLLLAGLFIFSIFGFKNFNPEAVNFSGAQFMTAGIGGFAVATNMLSMSTQSYFNALAFSKYTKNPKKNVLKAMLICLPLLLLIYVGVTMAAVGAVDLETFAGHSMADVAKIIMPTPVFLCFTVLCPVMALATTLNGNMSNFTIMLTTAAEDGWFPKAVTKKNRFGSAYIITTVVALFILIPAALNLSVSFITNNLMLFTNLVGLVPFYSLWCMPKKFPELWSKSAAHVSPVAFNVIMGIGLVARVALISFAMISLTPVNLAINLVVAALLVGFCIWRVKSGRVSMKTDYEEE